MKNHKPLTNFTALVQQWTQKRSIFTTKAIYQWALHGLVIQVVLFHCASSVAKATMAPAKLKRHLNTNHSHTTSKSADYFKRLLASQNKHSQAFVSKVPVSEKAQEASYLVGEFIAQKRKSHTVDENLMKPGSKITVGKMLGQDAVREIENFLISNSTINRGIDVMSHDAEEVLCDKPFLSPG
jgi:flagella basal body P-ring formation protein FlgA